MSIVSHSSRNERQEAAGEILISSVLLCWNRVELSRRCLASYLDTISVPYELRVVNNASTDGTREWADSLRGDERIREVIHRDRNDPGAALNDAFERSGGRIYHVMENDFIYLDGWDRYLVDCFRRMPELGQLSVATGPEHLLGQPHGGRVRLARGNVSSTSAFAAELFRDHGLRWGNAYVGPGDRDFSRSVARLGRLVAWPDHEIAYNIGHSQEELRRDPDYYIWNYRKKLLSPKRILRELLLALSGRSDLASIKLQLGRLRRLYRYRSRRGSPE